ncbi:MAG: hypothetical protein IJR00_08025 [Lachnospiraceae bacterium]|nr:hypothetical protein [Lachnospiraceae bacterium]
MDKGPHIIPLVPGGVPVIIHASQNEHYLNTGYVITGTGNATAEVDRKYLDVEFKLLTHDNQYYEFFPATSDGKGANDGTRQADLFYTRPDGVSGQISLNLDRNVYRTDHSSTTIMRFSNPYSLFLRDVPEELTEVAGDVECEIVVYRGSNPDNRRESSANFIIRVEPKPQVNRAVSITINDLPIDQSGNANNENAGSYYGGDADNPALLTWAEVVEEADTGDLREILEPGTLIRPVKLASGELMGIRCVHVQSYNVAYFEPYHLFLAPKQFNKSFSNEPQYVYASEAAGFYLGDGMIGNKYFYENGQEWTALLPYSVSSRITLIQAYYTPDYVFGGERMVNNVLTDMQLDLYKTAEGRIKTSSDGVAKEWYLVDVLGGTWIVEDSGADGRATYQKGDDIYVNPIFYIVGKDHTDPSTVPVDIQSWADVKNAAAQGKLLNSNLTVGQLMPELPTVGVLRCVHITENWAAFDVVTAEQCKGSAISSTLYNSFDKNLTEDEKSYFTVLSGSGNSARYSQIITTKNTNKVIKNFSGILNNTVFDFYKTKENGSVLAGCWASYSATWSEIYHYSESSGLYISSNGTSDWPNLTGYVDAVFAVGEIS